MMFCPCCEENLDETPSAEPCPSCGSNRRSATAMPDAAAAEASAPGIASSMGYDPHRPWQQKWRDVCHRLDVLRATYRQASLDSDDVRRQVEDFFQDCCDLAEWLERQVTTSGAMDFFKHDKDLRLCDGMSQTRKHHSRDPRRGRDPVTAWISRARGGAEGACAEIEWSTSSGTGGREDALYLARRCAAAWVGFFHRSGLKP